MVNYQDIAVELGYLDGPVIPCGPTIFAWIVMIVRKILTKCSRIRLVTPINTNTSCSHTAQSSFQFKALCGSYTGKS